MYTNFRTQKMLELLFVFSEQFLQCCDHGQGSLPLSGGFQIQISLSQPLKCSPKKAARCATKQLKLYNPTSAARWENSDFLLIVRFISPFVFSSPLTLFLPSLFARLFFLLQVQSARCTSPREVLDCSGVIRKFVFSLRIPLVNRGWAPAHKSANILAQALCLRTPVDATSPRAAYFPRHLTSAQTLQRFAPKLRLFALQFVIEIARCIVHFPKFFI